MLVTGGFGVIGSFVTLGLLEKGLRPVVFSRRLDSTLVGDDILDRVDYIKGDVLDLPLLINTIKRFKVRKIIHMSALIIPEAQQNPYMGFKINCEGTINILEAARLGDSVGRTVVISSRSVYGPITDKCGHPTYVPMREDHPKNPILMYDCTKLMCEHLCLNYYQNYGMDIAILRFSATHGPGKLQRHGPAAVHSRLVEGALAGRPVVIPQGGDQIDDMCYHGDLAKGVLEATLAEKLKYRDYNLGSGMGRTMKEFVRTLKRLMPESKVDIGPGLDYMGFGQPKYCVYDLARAKEDFNYSPEFSFEEGIMDYIRIIRDRKISISI